MRIPRGEEGGGEGQSPRAGVAYGSAARRTEFILAAWVSFTPLRYSPRWDLLTLVPSSPV